MAKLQELRVFVAEVEAQPIEGARGVMRGGKGAPGQPLQHFLGRRLVWAALVVHVAAGSPVEPRADARLLKQLVAFGFRDEGAKLREVVFRALGGAGSNREVLPQTFGVVTKGAAVQNVDDRLWLTVRKRDGRGRLGKRRVALSEWPQLI